MSATYGHGEAGGGHLEAVSVTPESVQPLSEEEIARLEKLFSGEPPDGTTYLEWNHHREYIATIRARGDRIAQLEAGIAKFIDYQQAGARPGEWSYTLADLRALLAAPIQRSPE